MKQPTIMKKYTDRQGEYNRKVDEQKRREYLALANGDESIAQAFWAKTERREWPRELTA